MDIWVLLPFIVLIVGLVVGERVVKQLNWLLKPRSEREFLDRARRTMPQSGPGVQQRGALKACSNCRTPAITLPHRDAAARPYCSEECLIWAALGPVEFCERCLRQTTNSSTGDMNRVNGIGRGFGGISLRCSACRSVVRRVWFSILYVPLIPLGRCRVIHQSPTQFFSRRLRS